MTTINPHFSAIRIADKLIGDSLRVKAYRKNKFDYLDGTHRYKLIGGQKELGEETVMTGREARSQNQVLMNIYQEEIRKEIDAGVKFGHTTSVLKRWVIMERNVVGDN